MTTVLLVEDEPDIRDVVTELLLAEGYHVAATGNVEDASVQVTLAMPDTVILDGRLPGMSGWEWLDLLRSDARTARLPVLLLTAALDDLKRTPRPSDVCTAYLAKPFDLDELLAALEKVIAVCAEDTLAV